MFFLYGPQTNLGHNSVVFMIECQVNHVVKLLSMQQRLGYRYLQAKSEAVKQFFDTQIKAGLQGKVPTKLAFFVLLITSSYDVESL